VRLGDPDVKFVMFAGEPAVMKVTLCAVPALLVQVTVPPFVTVTDDGENENVAVP